MGHHPGAFRSVSPPLSRRALLLRYLTVFAVSNRVSRSVVLRTGWSRRTHAAANRCVRSSDLAGRPLRSPAVSPGSLPVVNLTRSVPLHQIRLAADPVSPARTVSAEANPCLTRLPARSGAPGLSPCLPRSALAERKLRVRGFDRQIDG
ncbi:hypothetical protein MILUP08_30001 [Micromonospora lupini str. Lupac 08]|uniref:Uncharacterized protein n=1 Tax=Micromonospora lupini str. Lupac 08 TaxID=1150864 RepID=I0L2T5_9ACTN|nr:hypothetical protein MILUP08_30001 [Micromonospora lupini str. Lupac 08]